jgi:hypothetical protein
MAFASEEKAGLASAAEKPSLQIQVNKLFVH